MNNYNEILVRDVREGKLGIKNDGTHEELCGLLRHCFPLDTSAILGTFEFYYGSALGGTWIGRNNEITLSKSVKEFIMEDEFVLPKKWYIIRDYDNYQIINKWASENNIEENFTRSFDNVFFDLKASTMGDTSSYEKITFEQFLKYVKKDTKKEKQIIGWRLKKDCEKYREACKNIKLAQNGITSKYLNGEIEIWTGEYDTLLRDCLQEAKVWDLWFEPVFKEEKSLPKINGYDGKFSGNQIVYGNNCAKFIPKFFEDLDKINEEHTILGGTRKIKSIKLDSGVEISIEQIKEIVEFLKEQ